MYIQMNESFKNTVPGIEMNHSHIHLPFFCDQGGDIADNPRFIDSCHFYHCQERHQFMAHPFNRDNLISKAGHQADRFGTRTLVNRNLRTCNIHTNHVVSRNRITARSDHEIRIDIQLDIVVVLLFFLSVFPIP